MRIDFSVSIFRFLDRMCLKEPQRQQQKLDHAELLSLSILRDKSSIWSTCLLQSLEGLIAHMVKTTIETEKPDQRLFAQTSLCPY